MRYLHENIQQINARSSDRAEGAQHGVGPQPGNPPNTALFGQAGTARDVVALPR